MDDKQAIDFDEVMEVMDDDEELLKECFDDFLANFPKALKEIRASVDTRDATTLDESAHKLKGALRYLAANQAADVANKLEVMGKENKFADAETTFQALESECERVKAFINQYGGSNGA